MTTPPPPPPTTNADDYVPPAPTAAGFLGRLIWLCLLLFVATVVLEVTALRVGEHSGTTYGAARAQFEQSWGGPIAIRPPRFVLGYTVDVVETNPVTGVREPVPTRKETSLVPASIVLETDLAYGPHKSGWHSFKAFEVHQREQYAVVNTTGHTGTLGIVVDRPDAASLVYDFVVTVDEQPLADPALEQERTLRRDFTPGEAATVAVTLSTKGVDEYRVRLSDWKDVVVPALRATLRVDTERFALVRFGLPHTRTWDGSHGVVTFTVDDFAANQDLGVSFVGDTQHLHRVRELVAAAPVATVLFLALVFVWAHVRGARPHGFNYLFVALAHTFYFLFLAYLVRFIGLWASIGASALAMLLMFAVSVPVSFGPRFALRTVLPYLLLLTVGFTALFLLPAFKGIAFLVFVFVLLLTIMAPVARTPPGSWVGRAPD